MHIDTGDGFEEFWGNFEERIEKPETTQEETEPAAVAAKPEAVQVIQDEAKQKMALELDERPTIPAPAAVSSEEVDVVVEEGEIRERLRKFDFDYIIVELPAEWAERPKRMEIVNNAFKAIADSEHLEYDFNETERVITMATSEHHERKLMNWDNVGRLLEIIKLQRRDGQKELKEVSMIITIL